MHFVDTNILVYLHDSKEPEKQECSSRIMETLWRQGTGRLSFQVLHEFYAVATRKLSPGLPPDVARQEVRDLSGWAPQPPTQRLLEQAWQIEDRYGLSCWDSLIAAAALAQDCKSLLTEDFQHGMSIGPLRVINPFTPEFDLDALSR